MSGPYEPADLALPRAGPDRIVTSRTITCASAISSSAAVHASAPVIELLREKTRSLAPRCAWLSTRTPSAPPSRDPKHRRDDSGLSDQEALAVLDEVRGQPTAAPNSAPAATHTT